MKLLRYSQVAIESIASHKLRSALTMLGIVIGVAAVLIILGLGRGMSADILDEFASYGTTRLTIIPGESSSDGDAKTLTMGDAALLSNPDLHPDVTQVAPQYSGNAQLVAGSNKTQIQVTGTKAAYVDIHNLELAEGRFLTENEVASRNHVIVIGATVATDLFGRTQVVGESLRISGEPFTVVGVLTERGDAGFGSNDNSGFVPIGVAQGRIFDAPRYRGTYTVTAISADAVNEERVAAAERQIELTLRLQHGLAADDDNDFSIIDQASLLESIDEVTNILTLFLGSIAAISLLVGGIGIMNIMLVTVTERTKEIGLRKALGAHNSDVLLQFLIEAVVLTLLGSLIGIAISFGLALAVQNIPIDGFGLLIEIDSLIMALAFSVGFGLLFGLYPAMRATQLEPIKALRYE